MPAAKSVQEIHDQIDELKATLDQIIRAMNRKLIAGESTSGDRERMTAAEQKIAALRADVEAIKDEALRKTVEQIATLAEEIAKNSVRVIEDRLLALAPNTKPGA
jgi:L-lactate utilization protein LutB